jgi:hypothetical protein
MPCAYFKGESIVFKVILDSRIKGRPFNPSAEDFS